MRQYLYFLDFEERDSDIYIATFLKSGTTWVQVILYNLLHSYDYDFEHLYDVSPWVRNEAHLRNTAERVNQLPSPRLIKSHDTYDFFSEKVKGRFIFVYRDGKDVAASLFHHNKNYRDPDLTFDKNYEAYFVKPRKGFNWFNYTNSWLQNKNNFNIHYTSYERLKTNFEETVRQMAHFLGVEVTDEKLKRIKENTSFEVMKKYESKFGEKPTKSSRLVFNQFIRKGTSGEGVKYMNEAQHSLFDKQYKNLIQPFEHLVKPADSMTPVSKEEDSE